jgi:hypothetical protein
MIGTIRVHNRKRQEIEILGHRESLVRLASSRRPPEPFGQVSYDALVSGHGNRTVLVLDLRINAFLGTSENAVWSQIGIAVSAYVLVAIVKKRLHLTASLYEILQILSLTMFEKIPLDQLLAQTMSDMGLLRKPPTNRLLGREKSLLRLGCFIEPPSDFFVQSGHCTIPQLSWGIMQ